MNWARDLGLFQDFAEISSFATPPAIDRGIAFVPALAGLGCPHWSRAARGAWLGLGLGTGKADMMQALLEGVALRTAEVLAAMHALHPFEGAVSVDGGLSKNAYFMQFLSEVAGHDLFLSHETELTAAGLASLAAEACSDVRVLSPSGQPVPADHTQRNHRLSRFQEARRAIEMFSRTDTDAG